MSKSIQQPNWQQVLSTALHTPKVSVQARRIANLWAGYGSITELKATCSNPDGSSSIHDMIGKQVDPPRGTSVGHERKLKSYEVEAAFYSNCAPRLLAQQAGCAVPAPLLVEAAPPSHYLFVLSDLRQAFPQQLHGYSMQEAKVVLEWLAAFHAFWWEAELPIGLWKQGCYWHLDTRQEELAQMSGKWQQLKQQAGAIDQAIRSIEGGSRPHRTLVHGDIKSENIMFNDDNTQCAAYDFQYCGEGYGARDLAYLLCSSVDEDALEGDGEQQLLQHYHKALLAHLAEHNKNSSSYTFGVLQRHFDLCLVDYVRFMAGWGFWGNVSWAQSRARQVLDRLPQLLSEQQQAGRY